MSVSLTRQYTRKPPHLNNGSSQNRRTVSHGLRDVWHWHPPE